MDTYTSTATQSAGGGGGSGTVTSVTGTANQIDVATGTTTPVISLDPAINLPGSLTVGTGASIGVSGSGTIDATTLGGKTFAVPNTIGSTTPNTAAFTSLTAGTNKFTISSGGLPTQSNNLTLIGQGFPIILGATAQKNETTTADTNVLTVTPAATIGVYEVAVSISVSAATAGVIAWTLSWTDSNGNAQSNIQMPLFQFGTAAPALSFTAAAAGNYSGSVQIDVNNAGAAIVVKWVGGGTTTAKMTAVIKRLL